MERTILVRQEHAPCHDPDPLQELQLLAESAGASICGSLVTTRRTPHAATYIGKGKLQELEQEVATNSAKLVVFDNALSPIQERNIERAVKCRVLDRTGLILDIFAQRAQTREGKLQVELAQLRHLSTRLVRGWTHLERQKGGIGLRGPGETQLETDRRLIGKRIQHLRKRLARVSSQRGVRRRSRQKVPIPTVCLVGYTNAGKSSLFNRLTGSEVEARDRLFATLDPTMRKLALPNGHDVVLSDTVGFIRQLPHSLVQAFHSTLEEVINAKLLLHVVDCASGKREEQIDQVQEVLQEIGADQVPLLLVYNKADLADRPKPGIERGANGKPERVWVSARTGMGLDGLNEAIQELTFSNGRFQRVRIPAAASRIRALLFESAVVLTESLDDNGDWIIDIEIQPAQWGRLQRTRGFSDCTVSEIPQAVAMSA